MLLLLCALSAASPAQMIHRVLIDSMVNMFGIASTTVKPLSFDPASTALAVVYRYWNPMGLSGAVAYSVSNNLGYTYGRVPGVLNAGVPLRARYPTGTIFNPAGNPGPSGAFYVFAAPQLAPSNFGYLVYGIDPLGTGTPYAAEDTVNGAVGSVVSIWPAGSTVMWVARRTFPNDYYLWRTEDYVNVVRGVPPTWAESSFVINGLNINGAYRNGVSYFGVWAKWPGEPGAVYNLGYSKSADSGTTWSHWIRPLPDWRSIPTIATSIYDTWYDNNGLSAYSFDMLVDLQSRVHFFGVVEDTATHGRAIAEIFETTSGWDAMFVTTDLKRSTSLRFGDITNTGHLLNAAINQDGTAMCLQWLDAPAHGDTLADIWLAFRSLAGGSWFPINLSQTPNESELFVKMAPAILTYPNAVYVWLLEAKPTSPSPYDMVHLWGWRLYFHGDAVPETQSEGIPDKLVLEQNYPNPFNSETRIVYRLPHSARISLKIYDLLGRAVAVLVDGWKQAGENVATLDASKLSSGIYVCRLESPTQMISRKILLMK
jgi:hypothetical protein